MKKEENLFPHELLQFDTSFHYSAVVFKKSFISWLQEVELLFMRGGNIKEAVRTCL